MPGFAKAVVGDSVLGEIIGTDFIGAKTLADTFSGAGNL